MNTLIFSAAMPMPSVYEITVVLTNHLFGGGKEVKEYRHQCLYVGIGGMEVSLPLSSQSSGAAGLDVFL